MISNKALLLKKSLSSFYKNGDNAEKFLNVLNRKTTYSLRTIEWFCSNYAKKNNTIYNISKKEFNVYQSYKSHLDSYQKKQFDPFRREHKGFSKFEIKLFNGKNMEVVETTVGQLNFFKWCIEYKILDYISKNIAIIKEDMNKSTSSNSVSSNKIDTTTTKKNSVVKKKRQPLSQPAIKTCVKRFNTITIEFN